MDLYTFISNLIGPIALLVFFWPCRKPLSRKMNELIKGKLSKEGLNLEFEKHVNEVAENLQRKLKTPENEKEKLKQLLPNLSRLERLIVVLHNYEEMSFKEVAAALEMRESDVEGLYNSIVKYLRLAVKYE